MAKKICISGYYGFQNFGDECVLGTLISNIKKIDDKIDITVFSSDPKQTQKEYGVKSVHSFKIFDVLKEIQTSNLLISGGGSLLQDSTSKKSLIYYLSIIFLAKFFNKKLVIFAQGIGPIQSRILQKIAVFLLQDANYICVRDQNSQRFLGSFGIKCELCVDPVWNIELPQRTPQKRVGVQLREWRTLSEDFIRMLAVAVIKNFSDHEIFIYPFQNSKDGAVCQKFSTYIKALNPKFEPEIVICSTNAEKINSFKTLDSLIAMRYHACLLGIKFGIKTLPITYDIKVEKLANDFRLQSLKLEWPNKIDGIVHDFSVNAQNISVSEFEKYKFNFDKFNSIIKSLLK